MKRSMSVVFVIAAVAIALSGSSLSLAAGPEQDGGTVVSSGAPVGSVGDTNGRNGPWATITACPVAVSRPAGAFVNGRFLVIGGEESGGGRSGFVQAYDPTTSTWDNTNAVMNTGASNITAAVIGTDIYIPGGYDGTYLSTLQVYHAATDTWETITTDPLPAALSGPVCTAAGGLVYVFGGSDAGVYQTTTYIYDPAAAAGSRWSSGAAIPVAGAYGFAIADGGYIYYSGLYAAGDLNNVLRYDIAGDSWTAMPSLTTARGAARMWIYEGLLAVGGGGWGSYLTTVEEYDLSTGTSGTWSMGNPLVTGRRTFAAAQDPFNGYLYAGAGWAGAFLDNAERSAYVVPVDPKVIAIPVATIHTLEHDNLVASVQGQGHTTVDVTSMIQAYQAGASAVIAYAGGYKTSGLMAHNLESWFAEGRGIIEIGDWHDFIPNDWDGPLPTPTAVTVTVNDPAHPLMTGVAGTWDGRGFFYYNWPDGAIGWTLGSLGETDLATLAAPSLGPYNSGIAALAGANARATYFGLNVFGPAAGANEQMLLSNALRWVTTPVSLASYVFADDFESNGTMLWSTVLP